MHLRRFEAPTLIEAIRQVKEELGPDALVLSTRRVRRDGGWFGWLGRPVVEVVAAVDRDVRRSSAGVEPGRICADPSWKGLSLTKALVDPLEAEVRALRRALDELRAELDPGELRQEIARLARALARSSDPAHRPMAAAVNEGGPAGGGPALRERREAPGRSEAVGPGAAPSAGSATRGPFASEELESDLAAKLDRRLRPPRPDEEGIALFVGAPGVGKTTTVAKLAAREADPKRLAVVSTDTLRPGGVEPLRALARRLGIPFEQAVSPEDLARCVSRLERRLVLVDTAGRSGADRGAVAELLRCRDLLGRRTRVRLVLAATTKEEDLRAQCERYRALHPEGLVVTKIDESESLSNVANLVLDEASPPLDWLGTGQRVPQDLVVPDPRELARRILGVAA